MTILQRVIRLARQPGTTISADDFEIAELPLPEPGEGEVLVRNSWMSVDPYMRLALTGRQGLHASMAVGDEMVGAAIGTVEKSRAADVPEGALVLSQQGWRDRYVAPARRVSVVPQSDAPPSWRLGILGMTGLTAFVGIERVIKPEAGETIFISGAAGAVGSLACQMAKRRGARVLASAGSDAKCRWLRETLGVDATVNYRSEEVGAFLAGQCPKGLDAYFDNVGGPTLDAALRAMRREGRIGVCGAIAQYNDDNYRAGPSEFFTIVEKGLTLIGFNYGLWTAKDPQIAPALAAMVASGDLIYEQTVVEGLDQAPAAFISLFEGNNTGKLVVRLD